MNLRKLSLLTLLASFLFVGCNSEKGLKDKVAKILKENPEVLADAIKANPADILLALQEGAMNAKKDMAKKRQEEEKKKLEETFEKPLQPEISDSRPFLGPKDAPIVLVEYSDFECPFCKRGYDTVTDLRKKYGDKVRFIYKHLPLSFHPQAKISAQYFEAIGLQSHEKAYKFHDLLFAEQSKLKKGKKFLDKIAKQAGANMSQLKKDLDSKKVMDNIAADQKEAAKFGMQGTPGFLINGIPVRGAYPADHFVGIVDELKKRGKLSL